MPAFSQWVIYGCNEQGGDDSVRSFISSLTGDAKDEAIAMFKRLEESGDTLGRPRASEHEDGALELRGYYVTFRYLIMPLGRIKLLHWSLNGDEE